jgi:predicted nucleic acid-binding protein
MNAVDTNILFYARDFRDSRKQEIAEVLVRSLKDGVLLWQVASEYLWASRKLAAQGYSYSAAMADVRVLQGIWRPALPDWPTLDLAIRLRERNMLSYWDSLLVAACLDAGVTTLYSEDFDSGVRIESLRVVNPFL